jgi:hypothetical protein
VLLALVAFAALASAQATAKGAGIAGVVRDTANQPLPLVTVIADGKDLSDVTDKDGRFFIGGLPPGLVDFTVMRIGYRQMTFTATLTTDSTLVIAIRMRRVETLAPVSITAPRAIAALRRSGFYERQHAGLGTFMTPQHLDSVAPLLIHASELFKEVNGLEFRCNLPAHCVVFTRRTHDCLKLFIDGNEVPGDNQIDDVIPVSEIGAVEVYPNPTTVPVEFQGRLPAKRGFMTPKAGCGAIAVWTRERLGK